MQTVLTKVDEVAKRLVQHKATVAVAESCTGGMLAQLLTSVPGSSAWFDCGVVSYSIESKKKLLGVEDKLIEQWDVVSEPVAKSMAEGLLKRALTSWSIAITGFAGPGTDGKPVGTVCFAIVSNNGTLMTTTAHFEGDRQQVRFQACEYILETFIKVLSV